MKNEYQLKRLIESLSEAIELSDKDAYAPYYIIGYLTAKCKGTKKTLERLLEQDDV